MTRNLCRELARLCARAIAHLGIFGATIGPLIPVPAAAQASAQPPQSIFGTYGQPGPGRDSIVVIKKESGKISLAIKLYYSSGHTCQLNADGEWRDSSVVVLTEGLDAGHPCKLNASFHNGRIVLKDDGLQCAPVYCGTRGKLDNVSLSKASSKQK